MKGIRISVKSSIALLGLAGISILQGCHGHESSATLPLPIALDSEALGYYCMMGIFEHEGPKAQIHVEYSDEPVWFSQVRDAIAFLRSPEETAGVRAVYVNDMGRAESWDKPGADNWIDATAAQFVINSDRRGGMGVPEAIPFGTKDSADAFIRDNGGIRVSLSEIPSDYVLSAVQIYLNAREEKNVNPL